MATVMLSGLGKLAKDIEQLADAVSSTLVDEMLDAGAEAAIADWKDGITVAGHVDTGAMRDSVGVARGTKKGRIREIYPLGNDKKGVRNATKAYVIHYGTSTQLGDRFVDKIEDEVAVDSFLKMQEVFDDELESKGLG